MKNELKLGLSLLVIGSFTLAMGWKEIGLGTYLISLYIVFNHKKYSLEEEN